MRVLVDTCVLSEVRQAKPNPLVVARLAAVPDDSLHLSVITVGEITKGIAGLPSSRRRTRLEQWLEQVERLHGPRILSIDHATARLWGELTARAATAGRAVPATDGLIAATAIRHGLSVMTRNTADFQATGASLIDPWAP